MFRIFKPLHVDSLRFKLPAVLFIIVLPIILFLIYLSMYAVDVVKEQVGQSNKNMMILYLDQIDSKLAEVNNYILSMESLDSDLFQLNTKDDKVYYLSQIRLINTISKDIKMYPAVNSIFAYASERDDLIDTYSSETNINERDQLRTYLRNILSAEKIHSQGFISDKWFTEQIEGKHYLFRIFNSNGIYFGTWLNVEHLTVPLNLINLGEKGLSMLIDVNGSPMVNSTILKDIQIVGNLDRTEMLLNDEDYLVVGESSKYGNFSLVALIPQKDILANLPFLQTLVSNISIGALILLPLSLLLLRHTVLKPINRILQVMKRTRDGDIQYSIQPFKTSREFKQLNSVFNEMMAQIRNLKINVYEEQLNKQKAELKHMQLQLNPHFLMNSLNMIYSLALVKKYEIIQEMAICLAEYFRYMLKSNNSFVTLKEELVHVKNYLRIQELRFKDSLTYRIDSLDLLENFHVPPLVIQTFIENTVKHAVTLEKPIHIQIQISIPTTNPSMMQFDIADNGHGFPDEVMECFTKGEVYKDSKGMEHIGIWNMQKRLKLIYDENYYMTIYNNLDGGASIQIRIPFMQDRR